MPESNEDLSAVFAVPDFWKPSKYLHQFDGDSQAQNPFFAPGLRDDINSDFVQLRHVSVENSGFFKLPSQLEALPGPDSETTASINHIPVSSEIIGDSESIDDIWTHTDEPEVKAPEHRTWDNFIAAAPAGKQPSLVTEAGASVYDALLGWSIDPLELKSSEVPVVDIKAYFSSLLALALGQESIFFSKQEKGRTCVPAIPSMRVTGYSKDVLQGLEKQCHRCGLILFELRSFVDSTYAKRTSKCGVALAGVLDQILKDVKRHVALRGQTPRSLLELQSTVKGLLAILMPLQRLTSKFRKGYEDQHVLSQVFHEAYSVDYGEEQLRGIMREVLQRVSSPWIEFLEEWIGTRQEKGIPLTKANVGSSKGFIKVDTEKYTDDFGQEVEDIDFRLDDTKMPHFMPYDIAKSIFETGKNLRFIRECHPEHPLASANIINTTNPPKVSWLYDWDAIESLEKRVTEYHDDLLRAIHDCSFDKQNMPEGFQSMADPQVANPFFRDDVASETGLLNALTARMDEPLADDVSTEDGLSQILRERLAQSAARKSKPPTSGFDFTPHPSLLPVLSFGGIASAQSEVVNQECLRLLFNNHDLRGHLKMHRDFQLFGSGMFVSRLSHALFDPDLETAQRQAGVARQGGVMGLRLGDRDTWPPASSELRLALMGVLAESFDSDNEFAKEKLVSISRVASELPGDMSFAVRDLSQEEIDKCMNPDSLEALDFLRLSYKAPPALSSIITPVILTQYDRVFKLLLKIIRMVYVVNQLFRDVNSRTSRWNDPEDISYRFTREAHHFVSGITSFFMDAGVAIPWEAFEAKLEKIEADLKNPSITKSTPDKVESPDRLREFHSRVLDRIMLSLFLRKRQQPVLNLLEEIFGAILEYAKLSRTKAMGKNETTDLEELKEIRRLYSNFKTKVQIFITVCRALTEKSRSTSNKVSDDIGLVQEGIGEDHMVAQLLLKLQMNDYYTR
ncbi:Gamma-tubulin complex component 6 [Fusarium austroafricanum]|uniref:Spindle pole body component n=1 Tax=Fusarium austroafricanum TaxID=2364996 RepID=A0A8H4PDV4_9HYPO|nr:Gamma-tubulin complex component 6 [Fusarium austroafricanum]